MSEIEIWRLGWDMIENTWVKNYSLAVEQFDQLLDSSVNLDIKFLGTGLLAQNELKAKERISTIIENLEESTIQQLILDYPFIERFVPGRSYLETRIETPINVALRNKIIQLFVNDQAIRGNIRQDLIKRYELDTPGQSHEKPNSIDEVNFRQMEEIIHQFGFPNQKMIGKDGMESLFWIVQHADSHPVWQKKQLRQVKNAIARGELEKEKFAYLYDRIQINAGRKQRYGTQFCEIDVETERAMLAEIEDLEQLDERRMEMGLMPIDCYKRSMILAAKKASKKVT